VSADGLIESLVQAGIEEVPADFGGPGYRCAAWLRDGAYLPCVFVKRIGPHADRLRAMMDEEYRGEGSYKLTADPVREALKGQLAGRNLVTAYAIDRVEPSPFAIPMSFLDQIPGETAMSLFLFALESKEGRRFTFMGSHLPSMLFFDLPPDMQFSDFTRVHSIGRGRPPAGPTYRERPFFECFVDDEPFEADLSRLGLE
jgi:hypothetical protein